MVERRNTKFLPTKQYCKVPGCGLVYHDHENFSMNWPKNSLLTKIYPPKNTHYTVYNTCSELKLQQTAPHMLPFPLAPHVTAPPSLPILNSPTVLHSHRLLAYGVAGGVVLSGDAESAEGEWAGCRGAVLPCPARHLVPRPLPDHHHRQEGVCSLHPPRSLCAGGVVQL